MVNPYRRSRMQVCTFSWFLLLIQANNGWIDFARAFLSSPLQTTRRHQDVSLRAVGDGEESLERLPSVPVTPCTRICRYNANVFDGQVCIGCFRETYEIGSWASMAPMEKYYTLLDAIDRLEQVVDSSSSEIINEETAGTSRGELYRQAEFWKALATDNA